MEAKLFKREDDFYSLKVDGIVMATSNGMLVDHKLSLKNCQVIERGYDLDELALEFCYTGNGVRDKFQPVFRGVFKDGFRKALSILGDKKFSEEDVVNIAEYVRVASQSTPSVKTKDLFDEYQSLQQTEWDCIIEMEEVYDGLDEMAQPQYVKQPKLDEKGQLILKIK